jgi:hypothetical protein
MLFLYPEHITELYAWTDDHLPKRLPSPKGGRPSNLTDSELVTMLIWNTLVLRQKTLKDVHAFIRMYHANDFPALQGYNAFLAQCHRTLPLCVWLLEQLLVTEDPIRFLDATMLPVCRLKRAKTHKTARNIAQFGKNWQGWHYGFKLHAGINQRHQLSAVFFTSANVHDGAVIEKLLGGDGLRIAVGDSLYGAQKTRARFWEERGIFLLAPPHHAHRTKVAAPWQSDLLSERSKIESVFDYLKEHLHLVTSFARSVRGYFFHYIRILLGYQILALSLGTALK